MTSNNDKPTAIMKATLQRMPLYYNYLIDRAKDGDIYASSTSIAQSLRLTPIQVRKDLACVSQNSGKPRMGFEIITLLKDIEIILGYNNVDNAVLVGVGRLGRALLSYSGFNGYGLNIVAGFDIDEDLIGIKINGKPIMPIYKFSQLVKSLNINIGIITVSSGAAQSVCNLMVSAGIKAIWNFAPIHINIPNNVILKNENLAASLASLSKELADTF
ncbi:MAG: redox-sensing transcriptional repressor Rex [Bacteroidales bacterium]|jgi:redox-sensing transcriptional repressor|nr:redox-sensing transcriptional repressor Rex [Bacteroidales bacterium]MDD2205136.1 redox-sensing transcriptional repressor Rex [Bacteroidales bacterium]MDD3152951.1 redox-sensing transcriptional repressor Rex [Bacteroidales bacterium]MDD3914893.1 redox-sensing transcriptional repressor Rex [Bacteroidales bacterium]MDD4634678.1 redox-sensing transcriptional repressor Rex [Bacteroidales bacterium]